MPNLNGTTQTNRTGQLPPLPQARPASAPQTPATTQTGPASSTPKSPAATQTTPATAAPQDQAQLQTQQGTSATSISLIPEAPPEPPSLLQENDKSVTVSELNKLLRSIGLVKKSSDTYNSATTNAIKEFQRDNNLTVSGKVDEKTLRKLIDAAKEDDNVYRKLEALLPKAVPLPPPRPSNLTPPVKPAVTPPAVKPAQTTPSTPATTNTAPASPAAPTVTPTAVQPPAAPPAVAPVAPPAPVEPKVYANDFERVKDMVATQLSEKGVDTEKAFGVGQSLTGAAQKWDRNMPSSTMCYTAVKRAIDDAIKIPYKVFGGRNGGSAKTAGTNLLSKSPEFVQIQGLKRSDLDNLPSGAVIVYKPAKGHGHIGVQNGQGQDISDKSRTQSNVHRSAAFEVWFPVDVRGKD